MWLSSVPPIEPDLTCSVAGRGADDVVLRLSGTLSRTPASRRFERSVHERYIDDGVRRIHLNVRDLDAIDLEGVAVLVHLFRESEQHGKSLTVEGARGPVRRRLATTGILRIMEPPAASAS